MAKAKTPVAQIVVPAINKNLLIVRVKGDSPLIEHAWPKKAKGEMLDKQMKKAKRPKQKKDPMGDFRSSMYEFEDGSGYGFPAIGFKRACVSACRFVDGVAMTEARGAFHVLGDGRAKTDGSAFDFGPEYPKAPGVELIRLYEGSPNGKTPIPAQPVPREDIVRLQGKTADLRYRGEFTDWWAEIRVQHSDALSAGQIVNLFNWAGFGVGVGEARPEKNGEYGRFHVEGNGKGKK